jgi:hypothetical protein
MRKRRFTTTPMCIGKEQDAENTKGKKATNAVIRAGWGGRATEEEISWVSDMPNGIITNISLAGSSGES